MSRVAHMDHHQRIWIGLGGLFSAQSLLAILQLIRIPGSENSLVFGLSAFRLAELFGMLVVLAGGLTLILLPGLRPEQSRRWLSLSRAEKFWDSALAISLLVSLAASLTWILLRSFSQGGVIYRYNAYLERLCPLLGLLILTGIEMTLAILWLRRTEIQSTGIGAFLKRSLWIGLFLALVLGFIAVTGSGLTPVLIGYWGFPAVPLLEWQWLAACAAALIVALVEIRSTRRMHFQVKDWMIVIAIWAAAAGVWIATPLNPSNYAPAPRAPTYEVYPFNDGLNYDRYAQAILTGNGLANGDIPPRPLYVIFLAVLHILVGQDYMAVINAQTLVLAFFPAVLYLIGVELSGRPLGIGLALATILRDVFTNTAASFTIDVSYTKYYFSEMPTALLLSLAALLAIQWIKYPVRPWRILTIGGLIGMAGLIRTQSLIILPVLLLLAGLSKIKNWRTWLKESLWMIGVTLLVVMPWLIRNQVVAGGFIFDHPATQTYVFAQRYAGEEALAGVAQTPGESTSAYSSRLMGIATQAFLANPGKWIPAIAGNFVHNEINSLQLIPVRSELDDFQELFHPTLAFWEGSLERRAAPLLTLGALLAVFGLGLSAAWQRYRWAALVPLAINLAYNLWTSLFLSSGERFLIPVDWAVLIYLLAGLCVLMMGLLLVFTSTRPVVRQWISRANETILHPTPAAPDKKKNVSLSVVVCVFFLLVGASIPFSEHIFPQLYPPVEEQVLLEKLADSPAVQQLGLSLTDLQAMASQTGYQVYYGRAVFPRYYSAGDGEPSNAKAGYSLLPEARLLFYIVGNANDLVQANLESAPTFFPNVSDVIFIARKEGIVLYTQVVLVSQAGEEAAYLSP